MVSGQFNRIRLAASLEPWQVYGSAMEMDKGIYARPREPKLLQEPEIASFAKGAKDGPPVRGLRVYSQSGVPRVTDEAG